MQKIKVVIYDNDGMVTQGGRFSERYAKEFGVELATLKPFFDGPFKKCLVGEADLKEELQKVLGEWSWKGTVDELLRYWFSIGSELNKEVYESITKLREQGLIVCLTTNNEKYRFQYLADTLSYDKIFDYVFFSAELGAYKQSNEGAEKIFQTLKTERGISDKREILYWDDREENVENLNKIGFTAERYHDYSSFKTILATYELQV